MNPDNYKKMGFDHSIINVSISMKPSLKFFKIVKNIGEIIDYLEIIISDTGEAVVLLPLFPKENYFGIWIYSEQIINRQLQTYNELFKIAQKA
jgi:hypothetical protein